MSESAVQIISRGTRKNAEAAAQAIDETITLEGATYSILEEDEDRDIWRIDAYPTTLPGLRGSHILEGAGHWVQQERAAEVNRLLIEFLKGL